MQSEGFSPFLTIQPVFPYFLKVKLYTLSNTTCEALKTGFKNYYQKLSIYYQKLMESIDNEETRVGKMVCEWEYYNLYTTLRICLERQESINIFFCLHTYFMMIREVQNGLELAKFVYQVLINYSSALAGELGYEQVKVIGALAWYYLETQQYQQAKQSLEQALERLQALKSEDKRKKQFEIAYIYHELGIASQELREFEEARRNYKLALDIYIKLNDRALQARAYHQFGRVAKYLHEFEEARRNYQLALEIYIEFGDPMLQGSTYLNLGIVAQDLHEFEEAQYNYQLALEISIEFGDQYLKAKTYGQLGILCRELREFEQAQRNYQLALETFIQLDDRYNQANIYHQLGRVAQQLREFEQARDYYQQALALFIEFSDRYSQGKTYHCLGGLAEAQEDYAEARANLQKALEIYVEYKDEYWGAIAREALDRLPD